MCLAAKHLLWFPVFFCPFNLLMCWIFIFFSTLLHHPSPHIKADWHSAAEQDLHLVCLALLWFVLPGFSGWPVGGGLRLLATCCAAGFRQSERNSVLLPFCRLVFAPCAFGREDTWGELKERQGVLGALPQPGKVPVCHLWTGSHLACTFALLAALTTEGWESLTLKASLFPSEQSHLLFTAGDLLDLWSCNTARTAKGKNGRKWIHCLIPRWWCVWLTSQNAEWNR